MLSFATIGLVVVGEVPFTDGAGRCCCVESCCGGDMEGDGVGTTEALSGAGTFGFGGGGGGNEKSADAFVVFFCGT